MHHPSIAGERRRGMPNHSRRRGQRSQRPMSFWKYILHNEHGEKKRGSKTTKSKAVTSEVEIAQIAFLIESMNKEKSIPNPTMKLLSFNCEVAARTKIFVCPGWHKFAIDLGLKPLAELDE